MLVNWLHGRVSTANQLTDNGGQTCHNAKSPPRPQQMPLTQQSPRATVPLSELWDYLPPNQLLTITVMIDRLYCLDQTSDAIRYIETRHAKGKVAINLIMPDKDPRGVPD